MDVSLVNSVEFYSHLRYSGYVDAVRRTGSIRPVEAETASYKDINQVNINRVSSEKIGAGTDAEIKTTGLYVDILYPQLSRKSPVAKSGESFKTVLEIYINRPGLNARIYTRPEAKKTEESAPKTSFAQYLNIPENGFVVTVPGEHMEKLKENSASETPQDKLYSIFTNNHSYSYTGSLVNVTA
ncbi:MAG: hypothetical protein ACM34K_03885 [Bacillota bacterium]